MKSTRRAQIILPVLVFLSACASTPDPAEVCSAEWIAPRTASAVDRIEKRAKSSIKTLADVSKTWSEGKTPNFLQLIALRGAMNKMQKELTRGQGISDLKTIAKTCNDPTIIKNSMRNLLERQGASSKVIGWIENNPIYESLISSISKPEPVQRNG